MVHYGNCSFTICSPLRHCVLLLANILHLGCISISYQQNTTVCTHCFIWSFFKWVVRRKHACILPCKTTWLPPELCCFLSAGYSPGSQGWLWLVTRAWCPGAGKAPIIPSGSLGLNQGPSYLSWSSTTPHCPSMFSLVLYFLQGGSLGSIFLAFVSVAKHLTSLRVGKKRCWAQGVCCKFFLVSFGHTVFKPQMLTLLGSPCNR